MDVLVDTLVVKESMHEIMPGVFNHQTSHELRDHHVPACENISLSNCQTKLSHS